MQSPTVNLNKAQNYLIKLLNENLGNSKVYFLLGQIAEKKSDFVEAIKFYTLIEERPYHVVAFLKAAILLAENQQFSLAVDTLNQVNPENTIEKKQLILLKSEFLLELQNLAAAIENITEGLNILPDDIDLLYVSSVVYGLNNQLDIAENNLKKILNMQPQNHIALNALGFILMSQSNRKEEALIYLKKALDLSPNNIEYMDNLGVLLYKMGKISDSLAILKQAYKISKSVDIGIHLGEVLWISGNQQQAKIVWKQAWQDDPNNLELVKILNQYKVFF